MGSQKYRTCQSPSAFAAVLRRSIRGIVVLYQLGRNNEARVWVGLGSTKVVDKFTPFTGGVQGRLPDSPTSQECGRSVAPPKRVPRRRQTTDTLYFDKHMRRI